MRSDRQASTGTSAGFERVQARFEEFIDADPEFSAQLVAIWKGRSVVDLVGGPDLDADSLTGVFSVSKGIAAMVFARLVDAGAIELSAPVAHYWQSSARMTKAQSSFESCCRIRRGCRTPTFCSLVMTSMIRLWRRRNLPIRTPSGARGRLSAITA